MRMVSDPRVHEDVPVNVMSFRMSSHRYGKYASAASHHFEHYKYNFDMLKLSTVNAGSDS